MAAKSFGALSFMFCLLFARGVLTQEVTGKLIDNYGHHKSYVAASYVKHLESAGARVVPIWIDKEFLYYERLLRHINGVLFPGGATAFNVSRGYAEAGKYILRVANEMNEGGDYMPLWGTCLGFELFAYLANGCEEVRCDCNSENQAAPLIFKPVFSRLFAGPSQEVLWTLSNTNSTINYHEYCITEETMRSSAALGTAWSVLSVNFDLEGVKFVSAMEHRWKPYYAVQFHPEKPSFEWKPLSAIPHDEASIAANHYFAEFFVAEARKSLHRFPSIEMEREHLIYNYPVTMGTANSSFDQIYFFTQEW